MIAPIQIVDAFDRPRLRVLAAADDGIDGLYRVLGIHAVGIGQSRGFFMQ